jgi:hypothetical protein
VSARLGHATVGITLDTHSHVLANCRKKRRKIDGLLAGSGDGPGTVQQNLKADPEMGDR